MGFDTESKPTFMKGQKSEGPHVLQFATMEKAYIFQSHFVESHPVIIEALKSVELTKIGFGLGGDLHQISNRFGIRPASIVDLDRSFRQLGYRNAVGAKSAIAMLFNRKLIKSKVRHHLELGGAGVDRAPVALRGERRLRGNQGFPRAARAAKPGAAEG